MNKLEKIGLGLTTLGFGMGLGFVTNGLFIDRPKNYPKIEEVKSKIWNIEKAKGNLQKADTYFCSENFDNELKNLYFEKSYFENTLEYKFYEKKVQENRICWGFSNIIMASGGLLFLLGYLKRKESEENEKLRT